MSSTIITSTGRARKVAEAAWSMLAALRGGSPDEASSWRNCKSSVVTRFCSAVALEPSRGSRRRRGVTGLRWSSLSSSVLFLLELLEPFA